MPQNTPRHSGGWGGCHPYSGRQQGGFLHLEWPHHAVILAPVQGRQHLPSSGAPVINLSFGRFVRLYCHLIGVAAVVDEVVVGIPDGVYPWQICEIDYGSGEDSTQCCALLFYQMNLQLFPLSKNF